MAMINLTETEKAICQLLTQHGVIEDAKLEKHVEAIKADFRHDPPMNSLKEAFGRINKNLRPLSYEIKSVVKVRCAECKTMHNKREQTCAECQASTLDWVYFHGIANTEECDVSKNHGTDLAPDEVKFFVAMLNHLLRDSATTAEIYTWKGKGNANWSHSQVDAVVEKLRINGWVHRDYHGRWEIGVRTYLECKPYLESLIKAVEQPDDEDEESFRAGVEAQLTGLPQVATY